MSAVKEDISSPEFWRNRLAEHPGEPHRAIYSTNKTAFEWIEARHREIIASQVRCDESVLDVGCGYGRLLDLMPLPWRGKYTGIDISPDFLNMALQSHPGREFVLANIETFRHVELYDWAILISFRAMILSRYGMATWGNQEEILRRVARKILYLEFGDIIEHTGSVHYEVSYQLPTQGQIS